LIACTLARPSVHHLADTKTEAAAAMQIIILLALMPEQAIFIPNMN